MIFKPSSLHKFFFTYICPRFYGGSPPATPSNTTQTVNQNSIPGELLPYTKSMMGAAEAQVYQKNAAGAITGLQPYKPFSTNAQDYVAPFSPLQQQAQQSAANLQTPGQFAPASTMAGISGLGSMLAGQNYQNQATNPNSLGAYMSPYMQNVMQQQGQEINRNYNISGAQQQGQATQAGAFGGSREAIMASENERNRNMALNKMQAEGLQNAYTSATANQQFGATLGLQGMQAAGQAAGTMGNLGQQELAADTSIIGTQGQVGGQQQAQQQQAIDQSILDYKNAQQYPYMQLGTMSNLIRGIPMTNQTTTQYQAQPSTGSQIGGLAAAGLGAYAAMKAEGGVIEDKGYAKGGIVGYKVGGEIEESMRSKLEDLDRPHLQTIIQKNVSPVQTGLAKEVLATKLAKGGIVAFAEGEDVKSKEKDKMPDLLGDLSAQEDAIQEKINRQKSIKNTPINTNAAGITPVQAATLGPMSKDESLKNMALNQAEGVTPPLQASGIKAVEGPAVADKVAAPIKATPFNLDQAMVDQQQDVEKLRLDANKNEDTLIAEDKKRREEQLGPDTATAEYRKKIMDERANAPDEARRQMGMRLMEFGANWASTPGAPLVAGMRALKEGLPGVMEDTKANKKAMKDIDASIYQLDHADRLEQMGYLDRAVAKKEKAQELFMKAAPQVIDAGVKKQTLMIQEQEQLSTAEYRRSSLAQSAQQHADTLKQNASQFDITSSKPTEASMKQAAIADLIKSGKSNSEAYGIVEAYGKATKDPALGYRVAMSKAKLDNASDIYNAALGADAKQKAYDAYQIANREFETLQRAFDPTGEYGTTPPPSLGPNVNKGSAQQGSGVNQATLDLFTGGK